MTNAPRPHADRRRRLPQGSRAAAAVFTLLLTIGAATASATAGAPPDRHLFGWLERVEVGESRLELEAKLDTGADVSSLHTERIRNFRSGGHRWVEFRVRAAESGRTVRFRKRVLRVARIKQHDGHSQRRAVVTMEVCLGRTLRQVEMNLTDRSVFTTPILLGREALEGIAVVDPAETFTTAPDCPNPEESG